MSMNMKIRIGKPLGHIREDRKLTQAEIAAVLGIPASTYARIERDESHVEIEKVVKFAEKLGVGVQELLPDTVAIHNNSQNSGQGGGVIFGNQYFYIGESEQMRAAAQENKQLNDKLAAMEAKIDALMARLGNL